MPQVCGIKLKMLTWCPKPKNYFKGDQLVSQAISFCCSSEERALRLDSLSLGLLVKQAQPKLPCTVKYTEIFPAHSASFRKTDKDSPNFLSIYSCRCTLRKCWIILCTHADLTFITPYRQKPTKRRSFPY